MGGIRDCWQITFEFLNIIYLLKWWGFKTNRSKIGETRTKIFYHISYKLFSQNSLSSNYYKLNKNKGSKNCTMHQLMRPVRSIYHKSTENFCRLFWSWNLFEATFHAKILKAFCYSYIHITQFVEHTMFFVVKL